MQWITRNPEETQHLGYCFAQELTGGSILALQGGLGAGKTCFTQGLARGLGIDEAVTSPTFTLISEYHSKIPLYHMDLYRLDSYEDVIETGAEELFFSEGICAIEWSEKIIDELPDTTIVIHFLANADGSRCVSVRNAPQMLLKRVQDRFMQTMDCCL